MNHLKDRKPNRPDIQEILSRMRSRFTNEEDSDSEDHVKEENNVINVNENIVKEIPEEKSPDDEIAELMLKLNGQVDEELVASIRSRKKMYENHSDVDSTSSTTNHYDETEQEKPRIILTLRTNENEPDSYVSSSNLADYSSNCQKKKKISDTSTEVIPLKRSTRRSNDRNQSVLSSAIARKERTFSIDVSTKKKLPRKIKKEPVEVPNEDLNIEVTVSPDNSQPTIEVEDRGISDVKIKEELTEESNTDHKKKKKKLFRGGRYNIFKKKCLQKERKKVVKKSIRNQLNAESGFFDVESSETNSERLSVSVCSDVGTLMSSDRNDQENMDTSLSTIDMEDKLNDSALDILDKEINLCLCNEPIQVIISDEGQITCKAEDCVDGNLIECNRLAYHLDEYGSMPMLRANVALPFLTFCEHHMSRFFLHQSCPRCGRFCSEGIFMMCTNKHFSHIGCHQKDKGCLHCGVADVYDLELKRYVIKKERKNRHKEDSAPVVTVEVGSIKLTTLDCPPEIGVMELSKHLQQLKDEIVDPERTMHSVLGLFQACETNNINRFLSILGSECSLSYKFPSYHNRTALHAACSQGNLMITYLLLQAGANPNQVDDKMKSPMRLAAKFGHSSVVQCLLDFNGAPEIKDNQGMTSLHLAAMNGKLKCCQLILKRRPSMVNWKDNGGWTPLVWACENGHTDVVEFFMTYKPNTRIPDEENNVALHWAAISECLGVVKSIVEYDSEVNMFNDAGDTALHIAARKNDADIVSFLLEKGAMAWHKNKGKKRPIDCCIPNNSCYNLLKNVPPEQRKPVTDIKQLVIVKLECDNPVLETIKTPIAVKTTPIIMSEDITHGCEDVPIRCVNEIDDEELVEFTYIKENCYDVGNYVDSAMSHIASCNCEGACNTSGCKCVQAYGDCLYDENGRLNSDFDYFNPSVILYECNLRCRCHKQKCGNRVIQKGIKLELEVYKHKDMGWGVRTLNDIPRGTFVCEYVGEIITDQKANDLKEDSYLFNLENPGASELYCIDAFNYSNVSRFINHSCDPNLMSVRSFINHHDQRFPRIAFFAVQDIKKCDQLSYDYGTTFWKVKGGLFTCKCGKANCSFSEENIKSLHIDSDNEDADLDKNMEQSKTEEINFSNAELTIQNKTGTNKRDSNSVHKEGTKLSKDNNVLEQKNKRSSSSSSNNSSTTAIDTSIPINGLQVKKKSNSSSVVNNKESVKNALKIPNDRSTKNVGSKSIKNELQVMLKKGLSEKRLNGSSSPAIGKKVLITRKKSSVVATSKDKICCNGDKVSSGSVKLNNSKAVTAYVLRHKVLNCNKTVTESIKSDHSVVNDVVLKSGNCGNNSFSFDTSSSNQKSARDTNNSCHSDITKTVLVNEKSKTKNWEHDSAICSEASRRSDGKYDKLKPSTALNINNSNDKECILQTDQNDWS